MYDVAIIGTGPAGVAAALNVKIRNKSLILFGRETLSEKVRRSEVIRNYPGMPEVTGVALVRAMREQLAQMEIAIVEKTIDHVYPADGKFMVASGSDMVEAKSVVFTTGVDFAKPLEGELTLLGRGVSYCATCDGMLYRGKRIVALGTARDAEAEVAYLAELAAEVTYYPTYQNPGALPENVHIGSGKIRAILGDKRVSGVLTDAGEMAADGVFILRSAIAPGQLMPELTSTDGHIAVDRAMCTAIAGAFAAGDITGQPYQIAKAVGEGCIAGLSAAAYVAGRA